MGIERLSNADVNENYASQCIRSDSQVTKQKEEKPNSVIVEAKKYDTRKERKAAEKEIAKQYVEYGDTTGKKYTEKEAKKEAHKYVTNEHYKEEFETFNNETKVYADKKAYKEAKKANEKQEKELYKQYREQGLSRKEAHKKAQSQIQDIELAGRSARKGFARVGVIEADGTLGKKAQDYMVKQANIGNTQEGEVTSYHYDLKERRATKANERAQGNKVTLHQLGKMADTIHLHKEKNMTGPLRIGAAAAIISATTGAAYAIGGITAASGSASVSTASAEAVVEGAGAATAGAIGTGAAGAATTIGPAAIATAASPLGVLGVLFSDKGKKVKHTFAPGEAQKPEPQPEPKPEPQPEPKPEPQPELCPEERWESAYCDHTVKAGDDWSRVAQGKVKINGKAIDGKLLRAYVHAEKLQHGVTDFTKNTFMKQGENYRLYTDFSNLLENEKIVRKHPELLLLKNAQIEVDCDGKYVAGKPSDEPASEFFRYTGTPIETNKYKQDCHDPVPVRINN